MVPSAPAPGNRPALVAGILAYTFWGFMPLYFMLADHMGLSIDEALPRVADSLIQSGLKQRIRLVGSGKLVTSARAAWALCAGADFIN